MFALILIVAATVLFLMEAVSVQSRVSLGALGGLCLCAALLIGRLG